MTQANLDRDVRVRDALYRTRLLVNRTPHFSKATRREANRALETLDRQLGLNQVNVVESARAIELLNRAHSSLAFGLLRDDDFTDRFGPALRRLGLRSISDRLDEVPSSVMALAIAGPIDGRVHRDDLPSDERTDAVGGPLPPAPGFGTLPSLALSPRTAPVNRSANATTGPVAGRSQDVKGSALATGVAILVFAALVAVTITEGILDGFSIWDWGVIGLGLLGLLVVVTAWIVGVAMARR
jgi:hypothetical protein